MQTSRNALGEHYSKSVDIPILRMVKYIWELWTTVESLYTCILFKEGFIFIYYRHAWFPIISRKSIYPIFTEFGMGVYLVNSLHGIACGEDCCIAN